MNFKNKLKLDWSKIIFVSTSLVLGIMWTIVVYSRSVPFPGITIDWLYVATLIFLVVLLNLNKYKWKKRSILIGSILGILIMSIYIFYPFVQQSHQYQILRKENKCNIMISALEKAISIYQGDFGAYPPGDNINLVVCLLSKPYIKFRKEDINKNGQVIDPWNNPLKYIQPGMHNKITYDLYSLGANRKDEKGQGDDIVNW